MADTLNSELATQADTSFCVAFALGWETASLFRGASFDAGHVEAGGDALPGLTALSADERTELAVDLIEADLRKLEDHLSAATPIDPSLVGQLRRALQRDSDDRKPLRQAVRDLHLEVLRTLTAANLRLGRAYGLGHALADTCLMPTDRESFDEAFGMRLMSIKDWLADLASSFPPHSSRAVVLSLRAWEAWAADPRLDGEPLAWETHGAGVREALHRQGELWRDLLARDKDGQDMLDTNHYLRAANSLVGAMASTLWRFLRPLRSALVIGGITLVAGLALLLFTGTTGKAVGAVLTVAGAVGITGAGLRTRLGQVATQLQALLWGAELDLAIAEAVLIGPAGWGASLSQIAVPATGPAPKVSTNMIIVQSFRQAVAKQRVEEVRALLAPDVEFGAGDGDGDAVCGPGLVAPWVLRPETVMRFTAEPREVEAVGTGILITHRDAGAEVWRVREGKVRRWASYDSGDRARAAAMRNGNGG